MSPEYQLRQGTTKHHLAYIAAGPQTAQISLICIHGWACQASNYIYLFNSLQQADSFNFQVFAIDLPGHGKARTDMYPQAGINTFAKAVLDFISEMELRKVVLMGHSMGVRVILETYLQLRLCEDLDAANVVGLILLDGSHYKFRKSLFSFDAGNDKSKTLTPEEKKEGMAEAFRTMFSARTPIEFRVSTIEHVKRIDLAYNETMRKSFIDYDYLHTDDSLDAVGKAGLQVLNIQSTTVDDKNERVSLQAGEVSRWMKHVQEKVPQVRQVTVLNANHFPHVDQPTEVAKTVKEMMDSVG